MFDDSIFKAIINSFLEECNQSDTLKQLEVNVEAVILDTDEMR